MDLEAFFAAPRASVVCSCTREQLVQIASHYDLDFDEDMLKDELKAFVMLALFGEQGIVSKGTGAAAAVPLGVRSQSPVKHSTLSFEQQKELLQLQLEDRKLQFEDRKLQLEDKRLQVELENARLRVLDRGGNAQAPGGVGSGRVRDASDGSANVRLVPKFNERDPDTFFTLFECVATAMAWDDAEIILLLQCVLTGKAQEAYSAVCAQDNLTYQGVKSAVLKAYQLTAEAYRQRFRQWVKSEKHSCRVHK